MSKKDKKEKKVKSKKTKSVKGLKQLHKIKNIWYMAVKSSNIKESAFDPKIGTLYLVFKSSPDFAYVYSDVHVKWWVAFTAAKSKGTFFGKEKEKLIHFTKVEFRK